MAINSNGAAMFNTSTGCVGNGTFSTVPAGGNLYSWTLTVSSCPTATPAYTASGLATLGDSPTGGTSNFLRMIGATAARDRAFVYNATNP